MSVEAATAQMANTTLNEPTTTTFTITLNRILGT